jgi:hypothetical protein
MVQRVCNRLSMITRMAGGTKRGYDHHGGVAARKRSVGKAGTEGFAVGTAVLVPRRRTGSRVGLGGRVPSAMAPRRASRLASRVRRRSSQLIGEQSKRRLRWTPGRDSKSCSPGRGGVLGVASGLV